MEVLVLEELDRTQDLMFQHQLSLVPSHWSSEVLMILCPQTDKRSVYMQCFHACGAANFEGWLHFRPLQGEFFPVCWVWVSRYILSLLSCQNNEHNVYIIYIYIYSQDTSLWTCQQACQKTCQIRTHATIHVKRDAIC